MFYNTALQVSQTGGGGDRCSRRRTFTIEDVQRDGGGVEVVGRAGVDAVVPHVSCGDQQVTDGGGALLHDHGHAPATAAVADVLRRVGRRGSLSGC